MQERSPASRAIARASVIIIGLTIADKLLAIVKEILVAGQFGISPALDVFNVAYALPGIILLLLTGAITQAFIPLYHEWTRTESSEQANAAAAALLCLTSLFFLLLAAALYLLAGLVFPLIGFGFEPQEQLLGVGMIKLLAFLIVLDGCGAIPAALLQARKKFFSLQTAPLFVNGLSCIILVVFAPALGIGALVWGLLLGTACKTLFMLLALRREGFVIFRHAKLGYSRLRLFIALALPLAGSALFANANLLVDQLMATTLSAGSVSSLRYAFRFYDLPVQVVVLAFSKALFPYISEQAGAGDFAGLRRHFTHSMILIGLLSFPAMGGAVVLSHDLIGLLLQRGAFDAAATHQTAEVFLLYCLGLFFSAYCFVNGIYFVALKQTKPLLYVGFISVLLNILFNYLFMRLYGVQGIALATTLTAAIVSVTFIFLLRKSLGFPDFSRIGRNMGSILAACAAMLGTGLIVRAYLAGLGISRLASFCGTTAAMLAVYSGALWICRTAEMRRYLELATDLSPRKK